MRVVQEIGIKTIYLTDGRTASSWVRELHKGLEKANVPYLKSGLSVGNSGRRISKNALVGFTTNTNSIYASQRGVYFTSTASTSAVRHLLEVSQSPRERVGVGLSPSYPLETYPKGIG